LLSNILKNNLPVSVLSAILFLTISFFLKIPFNETTPQSANGILLFFLQNANGIRIINLSLSFVFCLATCLLLHYSISRTETLSKVNYFPLFISSLLISESLLFFDLHPGIISNFLILLGIHRILASYRLEAAKGPLFDGGFCISLAILVYFPSVAMLPLVFIAIGILRPFVWREWISALIGVLTPPSFLIALLFITGNEHLINRFEINSLFSFNPIIKDFKIVQFILLSVLLTIFFMVIMSRIGKGSQGRKIRQQKNIQILFFWTFLGLVTFFIDSPFNTSVPVILVAPFSILIGEWLGNFKKEYQSDLIILCLITALIFVLLR
jgi:hypothetical protein